MKKDIPGYEGYYKIDSITGGVWSIKRNKYLSLQINRKGYYIASLCKDNYLKTFIVHRIIAKVFISNPFNLPQVNHKNGIKTDNRIENLEWISDSNNKKHAFKIGLCNQKGDNHHNKKLTGEQVLNIRKCIKNSSSTDTVLSKKYNVSRGTIYNIKHRLSWTHL